MPRSPISFVISISYNEFTLSVMTDLGGVMKLTQQRLEQAAKAIAMGATVALAAKAIGIDRRTWYRWRERGQRGIHPYTDFLAAVDVADTECIHRQPRPDRPSGSRRQLASRSMDAGAPPRLHAYPSPDHTSRA